MLSAIIICEFGSIWHNMPSEAGGISTILLRISVEYAGYLVPWCPSYEEFVYGTGGLTKMKCDGMLKLWNFTENWFSR